MMLEYYFDLRTGETRTATNPDHIKALGVGWINITTEEYHRIQKAIGYARDH